MRPLPARAGELGSCTERPRVGTDGRKTQPADPRALTTRPRRRFRGWRPGPGGRVTPSRGPAALLRPGPGEGAPHHLGTRDNVSDHSPPPLPPPGPLAPQAALLAPLAGRVAGSPSLPALSLKAGAWTSSAAGRCAQLPARRRGRSARLPASPRAPWLSWWDWAPLRTHLFRTPHHKQESKARGRHSH